VSRGANKETNAHEPRPHPLPTQVWRANIAETGNDTRLARLDRPPCGGKTSGPNKVERILRGRLEHSSTHWPLPRKNKKVLRKLRKVRLRSTKNAPKPPGSKSLSSPKLPDRKLPTQSSSRLPRIAGSRRGVAASRRRVAASRRGVAHGDVLRPDDHLIASRRGLRLRLRPALSLLLRL